MAKCDWSGDRVRIGVVGAGIGGLSLAALATRAGHDVTLFEAAGRFGEVGAGIQLSPNGVRVLHALGLADELAAVATTPTRVVLRRWSDDSELSSIPLGAVARERWGLPYYNAHRADLVAMLAGRLDGVHLCLGTKVRGVDAERGEIRLDDGSAPAFDLVVGADGIHSVVRTALFGEQPTRFRGLVAHRALVPRELVDDLPVETTNRLGPGAHVVSYFVGPDRRFLNVVAVVEDETWDVESWTEPGDPELLATRFAEWSPVVRRVVSLVGSSVFRWALHDREPLDSWSHGRVALLGDACHPMVPFMAQGACQALEDAAALVRHLGHGIELSETLRHYESERKPRTSAIQGRSFANATLYHLPDGDDQRRRDATYAATDGSRAVASFDWLYSHDANAAG